MQCHVFLHTHKCNIHKNRTKFLNLLLFPKCFTISFPFCKVAGTYLEEVIIPGK